MRRQWGLFLAVLAMVAFVAVASAQNPPTSQPPGGRTNPNQASPASQGQMFEGKIANVDASKHEFTISDFRLLPGTGTGAASGTGTGGTTGRPANTGTDRPGAGRTEQDKGAGAGHALTVHAGNDARITLDGRSATFNDLKQGLFVRITAHAGQGTGTGTSGATDKGAGTTGTQNKGTGTQDRSTATHGQTLNADRIEAFSQAPPGFGTGAGNSRPGNVRP